MIVFKDHNRDWHKWFAYAPVWVDHAGLVWLEKIERRWRLGRGGWEYRMPDEA